LASIYDTPSNDVIQGLGKLGTPKAIVELCNLHYQSHRGLEYLANVRAALRVAGAKSPQGLVEALERYKKKCRMSGVSPKFAEEWRERICPLLCSLLDVLGEVGDAQAAAAIQALLPTFALGYSKALDQAAQTALESIARRG